MNAQTDVKLGSFSAPDVLSFRIGLTLRWPNRMEENNSGTLQLSLLVSLFAIYLQPEMDVPVNVPVDDPNADTEW